MKARLFRQVQVVLLLAGAMVCVLHQVQVALLLVRATVQGFVLA
jgi:hypothetical protein